MAELPDWEDLMKLVEEISRLSFAKILLDTEIKEMEAEVVKMATLSPSYYINGKSASVAFIESTWKHTGFNGEIIPKRKELADIVSRLEKARLTFEILKLQIEVWRSESANQRYATLS